MFDECYAVSSPPEVHLVDESGARWARAVSVHRCLRLAYTDASFAPTERSSVDATSISKKSGYLLAGKHTSAGSRPPAGVGSGHVEKHVLAMCWLWSDRSQDQLGIQLLRAESSGWGCRRFRRCRDTETVLENRTFATRESPCKAFMKAQTMADTTHTPAYPIPTTSSPADQR